MTEWPCDRMTVWPSDRVTEWPSDRKLRRRLTGWYIYCLVCLGAAVHYKSYLLRRCRKCEWEYIVKDCISICTNNSVCCFVHLHFKLARNILLLCLWRLYVSSSQQMFTISFKVLVFKLTLLYCYVCIGMITPHVALVSALSIAVGQKIIFVQCAEKRVPESAISSTLQHPNTPPSVLV